MCLVFWCAHRPSTERLTLRRFPECGCAMNGGVGERMKEQVSQGFPHSPAPEAKGTRLTHEFPESLACVEAPALIRHRSWQVGGKQLASTRHPHNRPRSAPPAAGPRASSVTHQLWPSSLAPPPCPRLTRKGPFAEWEPPKAEGPGASCPPERRAAAGLGGWQVSNSPLQSCITGSEREHRIQLKLQWNMGCNA